MTAFSFSQFMSRLLTGMLAAVGAREPCSGRANKTITLGIALLVPTVIAIVVVGVGISWPPEWRRRNRARGVDCASGDACRGSNCRAGNIGRAIGARGGTIVMTALIDAGVVIFRHWIGRTVRIVLRAARSLRRGKGSGGCENRRCANKGQVPHLGAPWLFSARPTHNHAATFHLRPGPHSAVNSHGNPARRSLRRSENSRGYSRSRSPRKLSNFSFCPASRLL
jgi:hypothetical protein